MGETQVPLLERRRRARQFAVAAEESEADSGVTHRHQVEERGDLDRSRRLEHEADHDLLGDLA